MYRSNSTTATRLVDFLHMHVFFISNEILIKQESQKYAFFLLQSVKIINDLTWLQNDYWEGFFEKYLV